MGTEKDNCQRLFEYLRSILYDTHIQPLDITELDEPYQKLGEGLRFLHKAVEEMMAYSEELSRGNLSGEYPDRDNFLCKNLKNLHANLNHLTWQAKQVAAGDYSQHVSYLGEFSEAFNTMTEQLKEREALLIQEANEEKKRALAMEDYNEVLVELTRKSNEWIKVVDAKTGEFLYCNQADSVENPDQVDCSSCTRGLSIRKKLLEWKSGEDDRVWEVEDGDGRVFRVTSIAIQWKGRNAFAHIIRDLTRERQQERVLARKAYNDSMTGISNRLAFNEYMKWLLKEKRQAVLSYMDLDHLKYVNDKYGHMEGDQYIYDFVRAVQARIRPYDHFSRVGGDEFCIVLLDCKKESAVKKMEEILKQFQLLCRKEYVADFSYGVVEISGREEEITLEQILALADKIMYERKRSKKEKQ